MNCLTAALVDTCQEHRIAEKWLLVPNLRVGHQWIEQVTRARCPVVNLRIKTLRSIAIELAAPEIAARGLHLCNSRTGALLVYQVLHALQNPDGQSPFEYLADIDLNTQLAKTMHSSIEALRLAGIGLADLATEHFEVARKGSDLSQIIETYERRLRAERLVGYSAVLELAAERLRTDSTSLPQDVLVLIPEDLPRAVLEKHMLDGVPERHRHELAVDQPADAAHPLPAASDRELLPWIWHGTEAPPPLSDGTVQLVRAVGEVNEVRAVLRACLAQGIPWDDVELLHTDTETYVPLVYETLLSVDRGQAESEDDLPMTLSEGIPCSYSRPGRALTAWLHWMEEGFPQARLVTMIKEGLIKVPADEREHSGFSRLALLLRSVGIGFGRERYAAKLNDAIHTLENKLQALESEDEQDDEASPASRDAVRRDLRALRILNTLVERLLQTCPDRRVGGLELIERARDFIENVARSVNKLDRFAAEALLRELVDMHHGLSRPDSAEVDVRQWLDELPAQTRVMGSGPRPGCLHVDHLLSGGHSGRGHTFLLGLDDSRFPGAGLQDPLLLDSERRKLSPELPTAAGRLKEKLVEFVRLLARLRGTVTLSFPCQSVVEDRELFPSSAVLAAYRLISGNREGEQQDLLKWLPAPVSFAPCDSAFCLDATEWWLWRLTEPEPVTNARELVRSRFPHLARGEQAAAARGADAFTPHDGHVPEADQDLDPTQETGRVMSSNGLQTIGQCPRKYFFKYGLNIAPPEDVPMDPDQWLDGLAFGSLIHELFEGFVREVIADGRVPQFRADYPRLRELLQEKVREYQGLYPPLNDASFQRRVAELEQTARTFLREDERYCQHTHSVPAYLEASIGMPPDGHGTDLDTLAPVSLTLPNGKVIRVRGRVDRIDRIGNGAVHTYGIWDYKSGSTWGYDRADPLRQGRKVQPFIYMTVVGHRLREKIDCQARVEYFGFFFPGVRAVGERLQWTPSELAGGGQVLQNLCQVVADGVFVATNDHEQDCTYCDYQGICGDVETLSATVNRMLECPENRMLDPFRNLRR